jgi:hypothetical protein
MGVVVSTAVFEFSALFGTARERWIARSEEPVRIYVPGELENVTALTGAAAINC